MVGLRDRHNVSSLDKHQTCSLHRADWSSSRIWGYQFHREIPGFLSSGSRCPLMRYDHKGSDWNSLIYVSSILLPAWGIRKAATMRTIYRVPLRISYPNQKREWYIPGNFSKLLSWQIATVRVRMRNPDRLHSFKSWLLVLWNSFAFPHIWMRHFSTPFGLNKHLSTRKVKWSSLHVGLLFVEKADTVWRGAMVVWTLMLQFVVKD